MQCPRCDHEAADEAFGDPAKCPECGVFYAKAQRLAKQQEELAEPVSAPGIIARLESAKAAVRHGRAEREQQARALSNRQAGAVSVVDIDMPFGSMVLFMVKLAIAAIPAFIILVILAWGAGSIFKLIGMLGR